MKTPEEIKKGLEFCYSEGDGGCVKCPYRLAGYTDEFDCFEQLKRDALTYIQQLEPRLAQVEKERDAAVGCIERVYKEIMKPVYRLFDTDRNLINAMRCIDECSREWRGVCAENTKEDSDGKGQYAL